MKPRRRLNVKVITNTSREKVEELDENSFKIWVKSRPVEGEANNAIINLLSDYLDIPKNMFRIAIGKRSSNKVIEIRD